MDVKECRQERFSSRSIGIIVLIMSLLLMAIGGLILPVVGFFFSIPLLILGIMMLIAPESKACQLIRERLNTGKK